MPPDLDIISGVHTRRLELGGTRATIGRAPENDVALADDPTASHLHAAIEGFASGWCVTDLGSSNGTWVNGERIWAQRRLRHGDEIRIGHTRLVFRDLTTATGAITEVEDEAPTLTTRERDVLVALCRPLLTRDLFTEPASTRDVAEELVISQAAVKQHLANLYNKFGIATGDERRRARLANAALHQGAISLSELQPAEGE